MPTELRPMAGEWTVLELIKWTQQFFEKKNIDSPRLEAEVLLAHVLGVDRFHLYVRFDQVPEPEAREKFRELVRRRSEHCPTQYLLGDCEFYSRSFKVTPDVLIPRPETELLVEKLVQPARGMSEPVIVDLCTGSGCIAVTAAAELPGARVYATDVSGPALAVAGKNAAAHGVGAGVSFLQGDLFEPLEGAGLEGRVDFLVSNPPYVSEAEMAGLMPEVRDYEPHQALYGGPDGLAIVRRIAGGAGRFLAPDGCLMMEIGAGQAEAVRQIVSERLACTELEFVPDLQKIPRILVARI